MASLFCPSESCRLHMHGSLIFTFDKFHLETLPLSSVHHHLFVDTLVQRHICSLPYKLTINFNLVNFTKIIAKCTDAFNPHVDEEILMTRVWSASKCIWIYLKIISVSVNEITRCEGFILLRLYFFHIIHWWGIYWFTHFFSVCCVLCCVLDIQ